MMMVKNILENDVENFFRKIKNEK